MKKKVFIISAYNTLDKKDKENINAYVRKQKKAGNEVYLHQIDNIFDDLTGYFTMNINMNELRSADECAIHYTADRDVFFYLGAAFALNKPLSLINHEQVENTKSKSYDNLVRVLTNEDPLPEEKWKNFKLQDNLDEFLICSVRKASKAEKKKLKKYVAEEEIKGLLVHYPDRNTPQNNDPTGYNITKINGLAIKISRFIAIMYNPKSEGSHFDLGETIALNKPLKITNPHDFKMTDEPSYANIVKMYAKDNPVKDKTKQQQLKLENNS